MEWNVIVAALGLVFIIEGIPYAAAPESVKRFMETITAVPDRVLRAFGIGALVVGLLLVYLGARVLR
jgi:uncharacterized protein YjeT (DUF2065 family)